METGREWISIAKRPLRTEVMNFNINSRGIQLLFNLVGAGVQSNYTTLEHNMCVTYYLMFDVNVSKKNPLYSLCSSLILINGFVLIMFYAKGCCSVTSKHM